MTYLKYKECFIFHYDRPVADVNGDVSVLLFDSWFDKYRGVVCLVAVKSGTLKVGKSFQISLLYQVMIKLKR